MPGEELVYCGLWTGFCKWRFCDNCALYLPTSGSGSFPVTEHDVFFGDLLNS